MDANSTITRVAWNKYNGLLARGLNNGSVELYSIIQNREKPANSSADIIQTINDHEKPITALVWSDGGDFLGIGDSSGKVTFWAKKDRQWCSIVRNSSVKSRVTSIRWTRNGEYAAIAYEDTTTACVQTLNGHPVWTSNARQAVDIVEWTTGDKPSLLCGTAYGEVIILDDRGVETGSVPLPCIAKATTEPKLVAMDWHRRVQYGLLIVFKGGQIQLMRNETDTQPITFTISDIDITAAAWFKSGQAFAIAGTRGPNSQVVLFFSNKGEQIRELDLHLGKINRMCLDPHDTTLTFSVADTLCFAQIIPSYTWAYAGNTLLYVYTKSENESIAIFFNHLTNEKRIHSFRNVTSVAGHSKNFAIGIELPHGEGQLIVTDPIGVTLKTSILNFSPTMVSVFGKTIAAADRQNVCIWRYEDEDKPNIIKMDQVISTILLRDNSLIVASGIELIFVDIPSLAELNRVNVNNNVEIIKSNCDNTMLSLVDGVGNLQFFDCQKHLLIPAHKEVWTTFWSADNPAQFAACERRRLYVFNNQQIEGDPINCLSNIADFSNQEILVVDLIRLMQDPSEPGTRIFRSYPTKLLKELKVMLSARPETAIEDILAFCKEQNKPRLWDELAKAMLIEMNFTMAERCYLETTNYQGLQFIKRLRSVKDQQLQRAQVQSYLGHFDEAQSIYNSMDRVDLAIEMRKSIGQFSAVVDILGPSNVTDEEASLAYTNVGDQFAEEGDWEEAAKQYELANNNEKLIGALFLADDYEGLVNVLDKLPQQSPLLSELGRMFVSLGAVDDAVHAFQLADDIPSAVDACVKLNHWKPALELAAKSKGKSEEIKAKMSRYAKQLVDNGQISSAVDFYVRAGLGFDAARLLLNEGDNILHNSQDYVTAKKCYVFAGLQMEATRKGAFDGSQTAAERLEGFMLDDEATTSGLDREIWRKAEGIHFYLLAHQFFAKKRFVDAMICAVRVFDDYPDIVGEEKAAALLARVALSAGYFQQSSRGFSVLEHNETFTAERREKFEELAIDTFLAHPPEDPADELDSTICTRCQSPVEMLQGYCPACNEKMKLCVASGRLIGDNEYWECQHCRHRVLINIAESLPICPLCHHRIDS